MQLTPSIIAAGTGATSARAVLWLPHLQAACDKFQINTRARVAAFMATVGVESGALAAVVENLNYSAQGLANTWPSRYAVDPKAKAKVPNAQALKLARNPQAIADNAYACRNGNGNEASCDGWRYRGRGLIQITGRANYRTCGLNLSLDLETSPELLESPANAALSAAWYWTSHGCNPLADGGDMVEITKKINGGTNGLADRLALHAAALKAIPA